MDTISVCQYKVVFVILEKKIMKVVNIQISQVVAIEDLLFGVVLLCFFLFSECHFEQ